jgi:hypothetical protein
VFHAAALHGWGAERVATALRSLDSHPVVALPLGSYSGEDQTLTKAARAVGVPCLPHLGSADVTGILSAAACVITTSMHAAIVGTQVGTPVIVPGDVRKTIDAMSACPEPPPIHLADDKGLQHLVEELAGQSQPLPSPQNSDAVRDALRRTLALAEIIPRCHGPGVSGLPDSGQTRLSP